ncbi:glycosyltransferase involved in cell wall biosynthesis [Paenibacillus endophyticus]|uniref:Glycosyltransferase involved in cell wall biosynthesis n=1 Tax=Paenibacillus endophyticus TaxID=1294268 RepID=A0A7W5C2I3_9BACL|nr:glycosyltransferase [Paenibacillus endophyticus]MBB3150046.1 glycosyltransferase involved in cell wall biosynthesis [Paenibacillus endophyticus]
MKKQILISVYDMEIGGIERSLINMLESFDYETYDVDLLVFSHQGEFMSLIPSMVNLLPEKSQYSVFRKPLKQCLREGHYMATLIRLVCKNAAILKARKRKLSEGSGYIQMQLTSKYTSYIIPPITKEYDLTISYAWPHDFAANKVKSKRKIAWIHTDYSKLEIDNQLDLIAWNKFDYIASISEACTESFLLKYPLLKNKITVIENITSPNFIKRMAEELYENKVALEESFQIVSVGRLSYVKGFDMAVQALRKLHDKGLTALKWYVVGYGGYEAELKALIAEYGLEGKFVLLGKKTNPYPYIKDCDLYVQPSRYEGKAVTVTEAQILGKPIIITNYPTAGSQVENGVDGLICELSPDGIATAIEQVYRSKELQSVLENNIKDKDFSNSHELMKLYQIIM